MENQFVEDLAQRSLFVLDLAQIVGLEFSISVQDIIQDLAVYAVQLLDLAHVMRYSASASHDSLC